MDSHYTNPKILQVGDEFTWSFIVKNELLKPFKYEVNIIDERTGATMPVQFLKNS